MKKAIIVTRYSVENISYSDLFIRTSYWIVILSDTLGYAQ